MRQRSLHGLRLGFHLTTTTHAILCGEMRATLPPRRAVITHLVLGLLVVALDAPNSINVIQIFVSLLPLSQPLARALTDSLSHAVLGVALWSCTISLAPPAPGATAMKLANQWSRSRVAVCTEQGMAIFWSCLIDVDHFVAARSLSLSAATHLTRRPALHAVASAFLVAALVARLTRFRWGMLALTLLIGHQLRDSTRRGLWLYPSGELWGAAGTHHITQSPSPDAPGSTPPVPFAAYLAALQVLPGVSAAVLLCWRQKRAPVLPIQMG